MKRGYFAVLILVLFIGLSSAKIDISDVNPVYSLGDKIFITVNLVPTSLDGNFEINLMCDNKTTNFYKVPGEASFALGEEQKVSTFVVLSSSSDKGNCFIEASLGGEKIQTKTFTISNSIIASIKLDKMEYNPGEAISMQIDAVKANGQLLEGFFEVSGATDFSKAITKGQAIENFAMPETASAEIYTINVFVYDKKNTGILNYANVSASFKIKQVATLLQTGLDKVEVIPGENLTINADLFDQSGKAMPSDVSVRVISPTEEESVLTLKTGESSYFNFLLNATAGKWKVFSSSLGVNDEKDFTVKENQKVSLEFLNETNVLLVKNIGNAIYTQTINVSIGGENRELELLNIGIGEERKFNLKAPTGEYEVSISDGDSKLEKKLLLTGKAISISEFTGLGILSKYPMVWMFIAIVVGGFALVFLIKYFRKKTFKHNSVLDSERVFPSSKKASEMKDEGFVSLNNRIGEAESSAVIKGQRASSAVIAIKFSSLGQNARTEVEKMLSKARLHKGVVEWAGDKVVIIFAPQVTRSQANEWIASKVGYELYRDLLDYNKKFADKITFGIGVHSGDLISNVENGKFKYTSVGGAVLVAKKIADFNTNKILISEDARRKILKDLRVQKAGEIGSKQTYEITGIADREGNKGKLDDLMKRMGK